MVARAFNDPPIGVCIVVLIFINLKVDHILLLMVTYMTKHID